jgi:aminopeptidase N
VQLLLYYDDSTTAVRLPVLLDREKTVITAARGRKAPAFMFANDGDYGYALVLPDSASVRWMESRIGTVRDDFTRAMLWGALWDLVREARLSPARYAALALRELPSERDEQIAGSLVGRINTALTRYADHPAVDTLRARAEVVLLRGAADSALAYGQRKAQLDAVINLARDSASFARLDGWLDTNIAAGLPLRAPTRWAIVTRLMAGNAPTAEARLRAETLRDSTTEGKRQAFVAEAARPTAASKREYFTRWFADQSLNEEWVTSSLRAFHDPERGELTRNFLLPALDTLPWIQQHRRIFFLGSWLGATIGGQTTAEALADIDAWLRSHPALAVDLRQKILQSRDELERTVAIRRAFGPRAM